MGIGSGSGGFRLRETLRSSFVVVPATMVLASMALAAITVRLDRTVRSSPLGSIFPTGSPSSTSELLSAIASATITLTALVFSITMLVLQLSSNQFSPRVLRTFLRDRSAQVTLGVLAGTFAYTVLVLRALDVGEQQKAPPLSAALAALLALVSLGVFVHYINHIAHKIRASSVLTSITKESIGTMTGRFPTDRPPAVAEPMMGERPTSIVAAHGYGYLLSVALDGLVQLAVEHDATVCVVPRLGEFVTSGSPLLEVYGPPIPEEKARRLVTLGTERTMEQDLAFGFRQLVDIVEKSMSPAMNDTTTAVQAVERLRELMRRLAQRHLPPTHHCDTDGRVRVLLEPTPWDDYVAVAVDEVLGASHGSPRIRAAVERLIEDAASVALEGRRLELQARLRALRTDDGYD